MIKVLTLSEGDLNGGASKAAYRLHKALIGRSVESTMIVQKKYSDDPSVVGPKTKLERLYSSLIDLSETVLRKVLFFNLKSSFRSVNLFNFFNLKNIDKFNPDIVHLNWICNGFLSIESMAKIRVPIVWTLHDSWPFCGCEHYPSDERYVDGYSLMSGPWHYFDIDQWVWKRKLSVYKKLNMVIVAPSRWIEQLAKKSLLFRNMRIEHIPYCIDTAIYKPTNQLLARKLLGLSKTKKYILFGAASATLDPRKGFKQLIESINMTNFDPEKYELLVFGSSGENSELKVKYKINYLGILKADDSLINAYCAANVFVAPSLQDNLPNTVIESLSCGIPCVAFDVGGMKDMILHRQNGYVARYLDVGDLAKGIEWAVGNEKDLKQNARKHAIKNYSEDVVCKKYYNLYQELKNKKNDK